MIHSPCFNHLRSIGITNTFAPAMIIPQIIPQLIQIAVIVSRPYPCAMTGILFAILFWAAWHLSPHNISMLAYEKEAIIGGEWWRLWSAHLTHFTHTQVMINSIIIAISGIIAERFAHPLQIALCCLIAMPVMTGLLLVTTPHVLFFRGASGVTAMMWMIAVWFMIVESKRFSLGYWLGFFLLLLFIAKAGMEGLMLLSPSASHFAGLNIAWLIQCYGALMGLAFFNGLHQLHLTKSGDNPHYIGPYTKQPNRLNQTNQTRADA